MGMDRGTWLGAVACVLASAALGASLAHGGPQGPQGPRGPQGPQGQTGRNAEVAHLGVCVVTVQDPATGDMQFVNVTSPVLTDGVASCTAGSFVSIVPQARP